MVPGKGSGKSRVFGTHPCLKTPRRHRGATGKCPHVDLLQIFTSRVPFLFSSRNNKSSPFSQLTEGPLCCILEAPSWQEKPSIWFYTAVAPHCNSTRGCRQPGQKSHRHALFNRGERKGGRSHFTMKHLNSAALSEQRARKARSTL